MAWIALQTDDLFGRLTGPEITAIQTKALATNQTDPIPEVLERVAEEVRGYVAACPRNIPLGKGILIPSKLKDAALSIAVVRAASRLPTKVLTTDIRMREETQAISLLVRVSECKFAIDRPAADQIDTEEAVGTVFPSIHVTRTRQFDHKHQSGI